MPGNRSGYNSMRNTKPISLFGENVLLTERSAYDVILMNNFANKNKDNHIGKSLFELSKVVESGLSYNFEILKWYQIIKRFRYKRKFNQNYILKHLGNSTELPDLAKQVMKLEGIDIDLELEKKKV